MDMQTNNAVEVLRDVVTGDSSMNEQAVSSAIFLAERLEQLKRTSPLFDAVSFSPDVETMLSEHMTAAAN